MSLEKPLNLVVCFLYALGVGGTGVKIRSGSAETEPLSDSVISAQCLLSLGMPSSGAGPWRRQDEC